MVKSVFRLDGRVDERIVLKCVAENESCTMRHNFSTGNSVVFCDSTEQAGRIREAFNRIQMHSHLSLAFAQAQNSQAGLTTRGITGRFMKQYAKVICMRLNDLVPDGYDARDHSNRIDIMATEAALKVEL